MLIEKKCTHYKDPYIYTFAAYKTDCGYYYNFMDGDIKSNGYVYCPFCSKSILVDDSITFEEFDEKK